METQISVRMVSILNNKWMNLCQWFIDNIRVNMDSIGEIPLHQFKMAPAPKSDKITHVVHTIGTITSTSHPRIQSF